MPHLFVIETKSMYKATVTIGHETIVKNSLLKILNSVGLRSNGFQIQEVDEGTVCSSYVITDPNLGKEGSYGISKSLHSDHHPKTGIKLYQLHIGLLDIMQSKGWKMINFSCNPAHQTREWTFELQS